MALVAGRGEPGLPGMLGEENEPSLRGLAAPVRPQDGQAVLPRDRQVMPLPPRTLHFVAAGTDPVIATPEPNIRFARSEDRPRQSQPPTAQGWAGSVGSPRAAGPPGGKVPATEAKRKSEVRGPAKRHRQHDRSRGARMRCW